MTKLVATVTQNAPSVKVRLDGDAVTTIPARVSTPGVAWTPAVSSRVLVEFVGRTLYVTGTA